MVTPSRRLALALALTVVVGAGVASAQTVIVRGAPPGSATELVLNATAVGTAKADPGGIARLPLDLSKITGRNEADVHLAVDVCESLRRVVLVEPGAVAAPVEAGCDRREVTELFVVRKGTTLVVDVAQPRPVVWPRQGSAPRSWLEAESEGGGAARTWRPVPTGLVLFGGGGFETFGEAVDLACGNVTDCQGEGFRAAYTVGAAYWINRYVAAEASYVRPGRVTANGSGDTYRFSSFLDTHILTVAGNVGVPVGPLRLFGQVGTTYNRATTSTTQTIDDTTVTIDEVTETIPGGTQTFEVMTGGWGWLFGGGAEIWVNPSVAIYAEFGRAALKGSIRGVGEGALDERTTYVLGGLRVRIPF